MPDRILIVEDDVELGRQIVDQLRDAELEPVWWTVGCEVAGSELHGVRLVILDLMLPGTHGLDMLKSVRSVSDVPVLVLSARNSSHDKVRALQLGADDYLTKPFWPEELIARVRARLRRPTLHVSPVLEVGQLRIDVASAEVRAGDRIVELTRVELELLVALVRRRGQAVSRDWLTNHVLDPDREGTPRTLDVHISRLRKKLGSASPIETVWGIGYRVRGDTP
jgi:DNA-binding response OmpR family regulator